MAEILEALALRRARRAYDRRPVEPDVEEALWEAVSIAPSHGNSQPTRVVVARSPERRAALTGALNEGNQKWAVAAPLLAAVLAVPAHDFPQTNSDGTVRHMWGFNAGIATGNLLAQATAMGLLAHPMAGFDEPAVRAALGIPEEIRVLVVVAAGYPGAAESLPEDLRKKEDIPQERIPLTALVTEDSWHEAQGISAREWRKRLAEGH
ncbi:MAG: nitroreductase family protein [Dehalococcoidia bacterium]|nr:nitroreductase family protein [Dehalococcoidia bacterium]MCL4232369.1 nitroreductase family protein [Dehalococcoidia bacterium]NUQ56014.1 nitroreductase family protein [Dehalococcoidia bacterium]